MSKRVLLCYLQKNKVVTIPEGVSDIAHLEKEFIKNFFFDSNVSVSIGFQRYDPEWEEYIELDADTVLSDKEKLKVVVTSRIVSPASVDVDVSCDVQCGSDTPQSTRIPNPLRLEFEEDCSDTLDAIHSTRHHKRFLDDDDDDETSKGGNSSETTSIPTVPLKPKKIKVNKDLDDSIPLPSPFPLPKHFAADVELALKAKQMTRETTAKLISSVAGAMLSYKRYPSSQDYFNVAESITKNYPHLKSPQGSPNVGFK